MENLKVQLTAFVDQQFPVSDWSRETTIDGEKVTVRYFDVKYPNKLSDHDVDRVISAMASKYNAYPAREGVKRPHIFRAYQ